MSNILTEFFATATQKASDGLITAFLRLPDDKRGWSPEGKGRTALDQVAECALLNGFTATLIETRTWQDDAFSGFFAQKEEAARDWGKLQPLLMENTHRVIASLRAVPEDALGDEIVLPWNKQTLAETIAYPYWNMAYHEGQISYLASLLGCLD